MRRFLNGEIDKYYKNEILFEEDEKDPYYGIYDFNIDLFQIIFQNIEKEKNTYYINGLRYIKVYSKNQFIIIGLNESTSNLSEFINNINTQYYIFKIKKINFVCICTKTGILILSFILKNDKYIFNLNQNIQFNKNYELSYDYNFFDIRDRYYIEEEDGSNIYLLYKNELIILSNNNSSFQIKSIIHYKDEFINYNKYNNKIFILKNAHHLIGINVNNLRIKEYNIETESISSFIILNQYLLFISSNQQDEEYINIYDINKNKKINSSKLLGSKWIIKKYPIKNIFVLIKVIGENYCFYELSPQFLIHFEFWKIENNIIFLNQKIQNKLDFYY